MEQDIYKDMAQLENHHWWFVARRAYLWKIIRMHFSADTELRICEIGCGTGGNLEMLSKLGKVDAVEINDAARALARSKNIQNVNGVYKGYLPDALPLSGKYDGVFSLDVIEHIKHDFEAVQALKRLVNSNGTLVVTVPAYQWLWSAHDEANHHFRRYTKSSFTQILESAGFKIVYSSYFNTILFPLAIVRRIAEYFLPNKPMKEAWAVKMPPAWLNTIFEKAFRLECLWAGKATMPFGLSIVIVAKLKQR